MEISLLKRYITLILFFFSSLVTLAQENIKRVCPVPAPQKEALQKKQNQKYDVSKQEYHLIPVVVHILHDDSAFYLSDTVIKDQVTALNEHFGRYGSGLNQHPDGANTKIRFFLAKKDPEGNPTNGIIRKKTPLTRMILENDKKTKDVSRWPTQRYMNIWIVKSIKSNDRDLGANAVIQGFAYRPPNSNANTDGIVLDSRFFGRGNRPYPRFDEGKTLTHEAGHYLNLLHLWGNNSGDCLDDDHVDDTPLCKDSWTSPQTSAPPYPDPCDPPPPSEQCENRRMIENYMEYSDDQCLKIFTLGQMRRMRITIKKYRSKLVHFTNTVKTGGRDLFDSLNNQISFDIQVYPQPFHNTLYINTFNPQPSGLSLRLHSVTGNMLREISVPNLPTSRTAIDLSGLSPGMYILTAKYAGEKYRQKVFKSARSGP